MQFTKVLEKNNIGKLGNWYMLAELDFYGGIDKGKICDNKMKLRIVY